MNPASFLVVSRMKNQNGGGSVGQSLRYMDPMAPERSAGAGTNLLVERGLIARPAIGGGTRKQKRGGFLPSVMSGVVDNAMIAAPLAAIAARKLLNGNKTRRGGARQAELWKQEKERAKAELMEYGRPTAQEIISYAKAKRRGAEDGAFYLQSYRQTKEREAEEVSRERIAKQLLKEAVDRQRAEKQARKNAERATKKAAREAKKAAKNADKASRKAAKEAKKAAQEAEKAAKKASKEAAKATKKAEKNAAKASKPPKPVKAATLKVAAPASPNKPLTLRQIRLQAEANALAAAKAAKSESRKLKAAVRKHSRAIEAREGAEARAPSKKEAWLSLVDAAYKNLESRGRATRKNAMKLASSRIKGRSNKNFFNELESRAARATEGPEAAGAGAAAASAAAAPADKKPRSAAQVKYAENLTAARLYLESIGKPRGPNMSKYIKLQRATQKGTEEERATAQRALNEWESNFKTQRPKPAAEKSASKKLSAVREENEEKNNNE